MMTDFLLPEYDREMAITRRFLERIPDDRLGWKPHSKSWTLGQLGTHLANLPNWMGDTIRKSELDIAPVGQPPYKEKEKASRQEMLDFFDKAVAHGREALSSVTDEALTQPWTLLSGGKAIMTMPRYTVLRSFVMNHVVHHRAHLGVFLRLCDVPVPSAYGPSADESA